MERSGGGNHNGKDNGGRTNNGPDHSGTGGPVGGSADNGRPRVVPFERRGPIQDSYVDASGAGDAADKIAASDESRAKRLRKAFDPRTGADRADDIRSARAAAAGTVLVVTAVGGALWLSQQGGEGNSGQQTTNTKETTTSAAGKTVPMRETDGVGGGNFEYGPEGEEIQVHAFETIEDKLSVSAESAYGAKRDLQGGALASSSEQRTVKTQLDDENPKTQDPVLIVTKGPNGELSASLQLPDPK